VVASDGENEVREQTSVTVLAENEAAVVEAGDDRSVSEGETVQLFANASDPEGAALTYQWVQTGGPPVSLTDINTPSPTFIAPDGVSNVSLEFEVRVSDGENVSVDRVGVEINGVDDAPKFLTAENVEAEEGQAVQLFAEAIDPEGKGLEYRWSQVGGPSVDLAGVNTQTPSFIAPEGIVNTYVTFEVSASDGVNTTVDIVDVLVNGDNDAPSVDAGSDFTIESTQIAALSATSADPEGTSVSHRWTQLEGPAVAIRSPNSSEASFLAPRVAESSTLVFQVEVSDGHSTSIDTVSITVDPAETSVPSSGDGDSTGDGGSTGEPDIKLSAPPTIVAEEGSTAELSINVHGSSNGLQYSWRQVAGSVPIDLSNADTANPTFEAPELVDNELYVFEATVQDNDESKTVNVFVRIEADNDGPSVTIDDSDTQLSKDIYELGAVTSDPENQNLSYRWTQVGGPAVKLLTDDSPSLRYSTANLSVESEVTFQLVVSDGTSVATDTVTMMGQPGNAAPNVDAGSDQKVTEGETVRLSSVASDSGDTELSYQWVQTGGPPVTLSDPNADSPNFDAPDLIDDAEITFKLTVSDGVLESSDSVTIHVAAQNDPPTVDAGPFQVVDEGESVTLQATGTDPEGQDLQYKWRQIGGVPVSLVDYDSPTPSFTAPNDVVNSYLTFEVHATDGEQTVVDRVMLLVNADNDAPKSDAGSDMTVSETTLVQLSGTATDPENQPLAHTWVQTSGPPVTLSDVASFQPTFEAPNVLEATKLTFELSTTDGTHTTVDSVTVTVTGDNDAATAVNATTIIAEDTEESVELNAIDPDLGDAIESFRIESLPDVGVLLFDGETVTVGKHFSASEIGEGALTFIPPGDWSGTTSFEFSASDGEQWSPVGTQSLVVSGVADVATISTSDAMGLEDTLFPLEVKVSLTDADGSESITKLSVTGAPNGTIFTDGENTVVVSGGQADITKFDLEQLQIQPAVHHDTNMTLSFAVTTTEPDSGHSTVTVETLDLKITAVQDAPVAEDSQVTIEEDTVATVKLKATEFDSGDQVETYRIESLPPQGTLLLDGTSIKAGQEITANEVLTGKLTFTPATNWSGETSFKFSVSDGELWSDDSGTLTIHVDAIADAAEINIIPVEVNEDGVAPIKLDFAMTDTDGSESIHSVRLSGAPVGSVLSDGVRSSTAVGNLINVHEWDLDNLTIAPAENYDRDFTLKLEVTTRDSNGDTETTKANLPVYVTAVNDAAIAENGSISIQEDEIAKVVFQATEIDTGDEVEEFRIDQVPDNGALVFDGRIVESGDRFDADRVARGELTFVPTEHWHGTTAIEFSAFDGDEWSETSGEFTIHVAAVADAPDLFSENSSGREDLSIPLKVSAQLHDLDGSETLSIRIEGVPDGASLSAGTTSVDGTWTLTADQLDGLEVQPPADFSGSFDLRVTATSTDDGDSATTASTISVNVSAVADLPSLATSDVSGLEDQAIPLVIDSSLSDTDGSESLELRISGIPANAGLSAGADQGDGSWVLQPDELAGLQLTPPEHFSGVIELSVVATSTESGGESISTAPSRFDVEVEAVADGPLVSSEDKTTFEDNALPLAISVDLIDQDGSETLRELTIRGVPAGSSLNAGEDRGDGTWRIAPAEIDGLSLNPPPNYSGEFKLDIFAATVDENGDVSEATSQ
ncbi:MAG: tandem-95 repeat protein, partial [Planctomycetota bacterium]